MELALVLGDLLLDGFDPCQDRLRRLGTAIRVRELGIDRSERRSVIHEDLVA